MKFSKKNYLSLLNTLKKKKYRFIAARDWKKYSKEKNNIILRHDIDFDTSYALEMAKIENKKKIKSTYFFLMRDNYYDLYSDKTYSDINKIKKFGHEIGIHINPRSFKKFKNKTNAINQDIKYFQNFYGIKIKSVSYHQPSIYNFKELQFNIIFNSYDKKVMNKYKYFSDSSMKFREKEFQEFLKLKQNIQLLIHPLWWIVKNSTIKGKLKILFKKKKAELLKTFIGYDKIIKIKNNYN